jgi:hypothetical protein
MWQVRAKEVVLASAECPALRLVRLITCDQARPLFAGRQRAFRKLSV